MSGIIKPLQLSRRVLLTDKKKTIQQDAHCYPRAGDHHKQICSIEPLFICCRSFIIGVGFLLFRRWAWVENWANVQNDWSKSGREHIVITGRKSWSDVL